VADEKVIHSPRATRAPRLTTTGNQSRGEFTAAKRRHLEAHPDGCFPVTERACVDAPPTVIVLTLDTGEWAALEAARWALTTAFAGRSAT
jgi:hypothetical protein